MPAHLQPGPWFQKTILPVSGEYKEDENICMQLMRPAESNIK